MMIDGIEKIKNLPSPALGLLPAVHDAAVASHEGGDLPAVAAGAVLVNATGAALTLPSHGPWPAQRLAAGAFAACDGRFWFPARRYGASNSYYPAAFERTLYTLAFTPESLPLGETFTLRRRYQFRLLGNNTDAVWSVVWEIGMRTSETEPAPVGPNIEGYVWRAPLIDQQVHVTDVASSHDFGIVLGRSLDGEDEVWSANVTKYSKTLGAAVEQLPIGNQFALRLRLSCFDIVNNIAEPRGFAAYFCGEPK